MSSTQNFFKKILPASWAESMEKESREWMMRCRECNFVQSVWERGGIRWKAAGNPVTRSACPRCGKNTTHDTYKIKEAH